MARVLLVEDEPRLLRALVINLRARGFAVETAASGAIALELASRTRPDVVVLDLGLPDLDGVAVIAGLRGWTRTPIIVLSARSGQADKVEALDAGADDYVTKPFGMEELVARIHAAVRRAAPAPPEAPVIRTSTLTIDLAAKRVTKGTEDVRLTPTEWQVLELLVRDPGRLVEQREVLRAVWGPAYGGDAHALRQHVAQLRRKLEPEPGRPRHLLTEPGLGYRFEV
jgi:two-component system KDP operon response regulator KdpE